MVDVLITEAISDRTIQIIDIIINAIIALVAIVGFITSLVFSIKSNNSVKKQIRLQSYPMLRLSEVEEKQPKRVLAIKNIGTGPAFNIKYVTGMIEENKDLPNIQPLDPISLNTLGVFEQHLVEYEDEYDLRNVFLRYAKEKTDKAYAFYSIVYYEDIFGDSHMSEARVTLKSDNMLVFNTDSPKIIFDREFKTLIKEINKESIESKIKFKKRKNRTIK